MKKAGIIIMIVLVCAGVIFGIYKAVERSNELESTYDRMVAEAKSSAYSTYKTPAPTKSYSKGDLKLELLEQGSMGDFYVLTYKITNNSSNHAFSYVEVTVDFLNEDGDVITSDWTYAVDSNGLQAGASQEFDVMTKKPSGDKVAKFVASVTGYN